MTLDSLVFWLFVAAWLLLAALFAFVVVPRIVAEGLRIVRRVMALTSDSTLPFAIAKAEGDANRISSALDRIPLLQARAYAAIETIRTTPIVPPALTGLIARVRSEIGAFRRELR